MAFLVKDRVQETCAAPGTGTVTLLGAALGYQSFSAAIGANNTTFYAIADQGGANWEVGLGTIGSGGTTLARTTILASSNGGSATNFSSGVQNIWCDYPAGKAILLDPNGDISTPIIDISAISGAITAPESITFDTAPAIIPTATGSMFWDAGNKTPSVVIDADVTLQLGQENVALVYNGTGSTITNGSVVAVNGAQGQRPSVALADADSEALSAPTLGIATEDIANGAEGFVTTFGFVRGVNTAGFTAGAPIYLSQTAGQFTETRPAAPAHTVALGWVIKVNASSGEVFVNINNGWELDELHNVLISSPISGNTLIYDAVAQVWKNANITAGTGISVTGGAGSISIANTGVTSVTGTSPVASSGGATPAISLAASYGDTQNPYASKTANYFLAAPNGSAGVPTFRAVVAADIPTLNQNTTGTASNVTGVVAIANGGTGTATANANVVFAGPATGAAAAPSFRALVAADIPSTYSEFAAGTALLFNQTSAPTGWTKVTTNDNAALRVVSGTVGSGGSVNFTTAFASQTPAGSVSTSISAISGSVGVSGSVGNTTLAESQMPSHRHTSANYQSVVGWSGNTPGHVLSEDLNYGNIGTAYTGYTGGNGAHNHGFSGSGSFTFSSGTASSSFSGTAINLAVKYVDVIIATKN